MTLRHGPSKNLDMGRPPKTTDTGTKRSPRKLPRGPEPRTPSGRAGPPGLGGSGDFAGTKRGANQSAPPLWLFGGSFYQLFSRGPRSRFLPADCADEWMAHWCFGPADARPASTATQGGGIHLRKFRGVFFCFLVSRWKKKEERKGERGTGTKRVGWIAEEVSGEKRLVPNAGRASKKRARDGRRAFAKGANAGAHPADRSA